MWVRVFSVPVCPCVVTGVDSNVCRTKTPIGLQRIIRKTMSETTLWIFPFLKEFQIQ